MVSMNHTPIKLETSGFGKRGILTTPWSPAAHEEIMRLKPDELELNTSKGWFGRDIEFIKDYEWLKSFTIIDMKIDNISPILSLSRLRELSIVTYCNTKMDFSCFPYLQKCGMEWRTGSESIFDCVGLTELFLNRYTGKSSAPFANLRKLEKLGILNASIAELRFLSSLQELRSLRLAVLRSLTSLEGLEHLSRLESFTLTSCRSVKSLAPLYGLTSLVDINVSNNGEIDTLAPLAALPNLQTLLFYERTNIVDGDLRAIFANPAITKIAFQNRRHYTHKHTDFGSRSE
jgi:Leucine-rich repeat (LRR) protein